MTVEYRHQPDAHRYALLLDGQLASVLDYSIGNGVIALTRAFTSPPFRNRGLAADLVAFAVDDIETTTTLRIMPTCWYVGDWFTAHPDREGLLHRTG